MRELLVLVIVAPFIVLVTFTHQLQITQTVNVAPIPTLTVHMAVPTPAAFIGPPSNAIEAAMQWLGVPYLWGGCTRHGIDCSCFVRIALQAVGVNAPRTANEQAKWATPISSEQLQPADLVFFNDTCTSCGANPTHVGLYLGGGMMIQAGGADVSIQPVFSGFFGSHFASAGRPR